MKKLLPSIFILMLYSCGAPAPEWHNIDWEVWKNDKGGCLHKREQFLEPLIDQKDKLKRLSEMEIVGLLGKPDQNELYKRNQKFFYYWIGPGTTCKESSDSSRRLSIRFNAVGKAKEIFID
jgi:hypothetical protein